MTRPNNPNHHDARAGVTDQWRSRWLIPLLPAALGAVILVAAGMRGHIVSGVVWFAVLSAVGALSPIAARFEATRRGHRHDEDERAASHQHARDVDRRHTSSSSRSRDVPPSRSRAERAPAHIPRSSPSAGSPMPSHSGVAIRKVIVPPRARHHAVAVDSRGSARIAGSPDLGPNR